MLLQPGPKTVSDVNTEKRMPTSVQPETQRRFRGILARLEEPKEHATVLADVNIACIAVYARRCLTDGRILDKLQRGVPR